LCEKIEPYETFKSMGRIGLVGFNRRTIAEKLELENPDLAYNEGFNKVHNHVTLRERSSVTKESRSLW
jgi:hypothetical protein